MAEDVATHYSGGGDLIDRITRQLRHSGKDLDKLTTADLATLDEFHIRGRKATLELARQMRLSADSRVLDLGSGLGGPARTLAEEHGCHVTGIDLTEAFCEAAQAMSGWAGLNGLTTFRQGDATDLPFADNAFDAVMTIHVAMNIPAKDRMYAEARRVLEPGGIFAVYDVLQGEGGGPVFPVPWAREPSISFLATPGEMVALLDGAGFEILSIEDSSEASLTWFENLLDRSKGAGPAPSTTRVLFDTDFKAMMQNQIRNLKERRVRTVSYIAKA